jgi:sugar phosphate isomerase/epimerase
MPEHGPPMAASAVDVLRRYADRVVSIHLKDGPINSDPNQHVAVGSGQMPVREIVQAARQAIHVVELDGYSGADIFDPLRDSVTYLRGRRSTT